MRRGPDLVIRAYALVAAAGFLALALGIRWVTGDWHGTGVWSQYSGTALYASMVYAFVLVLRPRLGPAWACLIAVVLCWVMELAQLTGVPAELSSHSLLLRAALGKQFDWVDMWWYPVGIVPLALVDGVLRPRTRLISETG